MKFSIFYEMQIAGPTRETEAQMFRDCLEQAVFSEELGYHCVWEVEHHGLYEYSHSSAPEIFLSFVAAKTSRIRIGHGVTLLPFRYNHPIRIAERIATLDVLSEGRLSWGTGKSSSEVEKVAFENDAEALHEQWLEALKIIPRMWAEDVFEYHGKFFDIAPIQVVPKPVQQPHPPVFAACSKPESVFAVGDLGLGALNFALGSDEYLADRVQKYKARAEAADPIVPQRNAYYACTPTTLVLDDDRKACRYGMRGARFFTNALARYYFHGDRPTGTLDIPREFFTDDELDEAMAARAEAAIGAVIGDPVHARERVARYAEAGVDELILVMQMGTVPHELVMESLRTFAEKVMPHFD